MNIQGLQKLSLLDFPGKVACTVFTGGCNLRCPFCHNAQLVLNPQAPPAITDQELLTFLRKRSGILEGVCISGGEPLLRADLEPLLREIRALGYAIKVDTNGCFPQQLAKLIDLDLVDYIAMDIKNSPTQYAATVGLADFDLKPVQESIDILQNGAVPFEFRTTVVRGLHDENSFHQLGQWLAGAPHYYLQQFVDSGNLLGETEGGFTPDEMANFLAIIRSYIPMAELRGIDI